MQNLGHKKRVSYSHRTAQLHTFAAFPPWWILKELGVKGLRSIGTYWLLETQPEEWTNLSTAKLKEKALLIDAQLESCQFKTIVLRDAKIANFFF